MADKKYTSSLNASKNEIEKKEWNLYTFSKTGRAAKFYKWLYGIDPSVEYPGMCPYFWTYLFTIIILPIVLIFKLFGAAGTTALNNLRTYKNRREIKRGLHFVNKIKVVTDHKQAMKLYESKCYNKYYYNLTEEDIIRVKYLRVLYYNLKDKKETKVYAKRKEIKQNLQEAGNSTFGKILGIFIVSGLSAFVLYFLYQAGKIIFKLLGEVEWIKVGAFCLAVIGAVITIFLIYNIWKYVFKPAIKCMPCWDYSWINKLGFIANFLGWICDLIKSAFIFIAKTISLVFDMIGNWYNDNCPRITWKD